MPRSAPPGAAPSAGKCLPRLYAIDGLRLLAALAVVLFHFIGLVPSGPGVWGRSPAEVFPLAHRIAAYGWLGVELFFMISGFVICMSAWDRTLRDFIVSRVTRLFPAFWVCVLTTAVFLRLTGDRGMTPSRVLTNLTMVPEPLNVRYVDPAYWSLWSELRFYLLFAVLAWTGLTYRRVVGFCGLWLVAAVIAPVSGLPLLTVVFQPAYAPFYIAGILVYLLHRFGPSPTLWLMLGGTWLLAQHRLVALVQGARTGDRISWSIALALITAGLALLVALAMGRLRFLNRPWLVAAGALTYPLYLLHECIGWTLISWFHPHVPPYPLLAALVAGLTATAWLTYRFIERPLGRRLKTALAGPGRRPVSTTP